MKGPASEFFKKRKPRLLVKKQQMIKNTIIDKIKIFHIHIDNQMFTYRSIFIFLAIFGVFAQSQIFINYGVDVEGVQLFKFFHKVNNGFYVDIGAYDSIFASNTLNLQTMGWDGINIDASPDRLPRFFYMRPWENSINYAIGNQDQFVTLYELAEDSSSTVSPKVKEYVKGFKPVVKQQNIPSMSMKQLCQRYFYRRPLFINLDIEGYGSKALSSNDWNNPNCVPDIFFSEINEETRISGLTLPEQIFKQKGYKKWGKVVGLNEIYILQKEYARYEALYWEGDKILAGKQITNIMYFGGTLASRLGLQTNLVPHHQAKTDQIHYHFAKNKEVIDIEKINKFSNQISTNNKNKPIFIFNYNPHSSIIAVRNTQYSIVSTNTNLASWMTQQNVLIHNLTVWKSKQQKFSVFIFDHKIVPASRPKIVILEKAPLKKAQEQTKKQDSSVGQSSIQTKVLNKLQKLLNFSLEITNKTDRNVEQRMKQFMNTILTQHHYTKVRLEQFDTSLSKLLQSFNTYKQTEQSKTEEIAYEDSGEVNDFIKRQAWILLITFISLLVINLTICFAIKSPSSRQSRVKLKGGSENSSTNVGTQELQQDQEEENQDKK